ncbi:MAG: SDR family NAD(P)-dependent oxidoreductase, partial [Bacteroidia bacterium]
MTNNHNPFQLAGKTILITGASSGIGRATAIACSQMGASCILTGRNKERLLETQAQLTGNTHIIIVADLTQIEDREELVNTISTIDGLVWCAGVVNPFPIRFLDEKKL